MVSYKEAGVDKQEGYRSVELMKKSVRRTQNKQVLSNLGGFGALFALGQYEDPVLVSGTDGVGTKLMLALESKRYDSVGVDCVAMCVNDILCHGAKPLFFLDYMACGKLEAEIAAQLVAGMAHGCEMAGAALVGGETAEMPGFYKPGDYDLAGFAVGVVERAKLINGNAVKPGDMIIGLPSSGFHSNGFSLIRKIITNMEENFAGRSWFDWFLEPTRIYVKPVLAVLEKFNIHGMAHITGGGLPENLPRCLGNSKNMAVVSKNSIVIPEMFREIARRGKIAEAEMFGTFNMGIGFAIIVANKVAEEVCECLRKNGEEPIIIGQVEKGKQRICFV